MRTIRRLMNVLLTFIGVVTLTSFIGFHLGYEGLVLIGEVELPLWFYALCKIILCVYQLAIVTCTVLDEYSRKVIKPIIIVTMEYLLSTAILSLFGSVSAMANCAASGIIPMLCLIAIAGWQGKLNKVFLGRAVAIAFTITTYQFITIVTKTGDFTLGYNALSQYQWFMWSIDMNIFITILFAWGGVKNELVGEILKRFSRKHVLRSETIGVAHSDNEDREAVAAFVSLVGFQRIFAVATMISIQIVQWGIMMAICAIGNVLAEGILISLSFAVHGFIIKRRWHSKSGTGCLLFCSAMFYVAAKAIPSTGYSQLIAIVIGIVLLLGLNRIDVYICEHASMSNELKRLTEHKFCCTTANEDEIRARCLELGKNDEYANFVILAFRSGLRQKEIAAKTGLTVETVRKYKRIRRKELEAQ